MENACIAVKKMTDRVYLLDDRGQSTGFLVVGTKKALMIDTMCGGEDLEALARRYTELPLVTVISDMLPEPPLELKSTVYVVGAAETVLLA